MYFVNTPLTIHGQSHQAHSSKVFGFLLLAVPVVGHRDQLEQRTKQAEPEEAVAHLYADGFLPQALPGQKV